MELVKHLAKDESQWQVQVRDFAEGKNIIGKNWISRFLDRHPILSIKLPVASTVSVLMQAILVSSMTISQSLAKSCAPADLLQKRLQTSIRTLLWG